MMCTYKSVPPKQTVLNLSRVFKHTGAVDPHDIQEVIYSPPLTLTNQKKSNNSFPNAVMYTAIMDHHGYVPFIISFSSQAEHLRVCNMTTSSYLLDMSLNSRHRTKQETYRNINSVWSPPTRAGTDMEQVTLSPHVNLGTHGIKCYMPVCRP